MEWVQWSDVRDRDNNRMIKIGGMYYPVSVAREIAVQILNLLANRTTPDPE
jgi:hypothetical protein